MAEWWDGSSLVEVGGDRTRPRMTLWLMTQRNPLGKLVYNPSTGGLSLNALLHFNASAEQDSNIILK